LFLSGANTSRVIYPTLCVDTALTMNITHATTGATGINLPPEHREAHRTPITISRTAGNIHPIILFRPNEGKSSNFTEQQQQHLLSQHQSNTTPTLCIDTHNKILSPTI
jgi:hypothetical protein